MSGDAASWSRAQDAASEDKLLVFGYSCKIFRDDEKATYIGQGKHLIPWMGDESLMIDRYDVRGYLHDLKPHEPTPNASLDDTLLEEEEKLCDEERYRSLRSDLTEEQLYQEEELKRLRAAVASDGAYHEIGFSYDTVENENYIEPQMAKVDEAEDELYKLPPGLEVPKGIELPYNMKIHAIIEKTAMFVSEQGGQMEIIIKMKQHANPQFAFMHLDNPLYPYYKHLVKEIKAGRYKPEQVKKSASHEDDDDDDHYLHPSLLSGRTENTPKFTVPSINFRREYDDSYAVLVRNLQQQITEDAQTQAYHEASNAQYYEDTSDSPYEAYYDDGSNTPYPSSRARMMVPPPPDVQPVIDKMAEYVAKNGEDFETVVKSKKDKRFDFLHPWHEYYQYYIYKRNMAKQSDQAHVPSSSSKYLYSTKPDSTVRVPNLQSVPAPSPKNYEESSCQEMETKIDALQTEDSIQSQPSIDERNDSVDSNDLPSGLFKTNRSPSKMKQKVVKGPISFSLKVKDAEVSGSEKAKMSYRLLDDSEEENGEEGKARTEFLRRKAADESKDETENKLSKMSSETLEAKLAEDRIKDKLIAAARERIVSQKRDKQLQIERKRKVAAFVELLKKRNTNAENAPANQENSAAADKAADSDASDDFSDSSLSQNGIIFPSEKNHTSVPETSSGVKPSISSDSESAGEGSTQAAVNSVKVDSKTQKQDSEKKKHSRTKDSEKSSSSKSKSRSKKRHRSRSPSKKHKTRREKVLPAAYAIANRSRSRSRSPRRHRKLRLQSPDWWNRRRM